MCKIDETRMMTGKYHRMEQLEKIFHRAAEKERMAKTAAAYEIWHTYRVLAAKKYNAMVGRVVLIP